MTRLFLLLCFRYYLFILFQFLNYSYYCFNLEIAKRSQTWQQTQYND